jgi:long-subunit acyl-CoA synthetase (AMP-forming)
VVPAPLEDVFARSPFIAQIFISGNNNPHPIALIVPNYVNLVPWCQKYAAELSAKAPTPEQLANPDRTTLEIFDEPAFTDLINQEVRHAPFEHADACFSLWHFVHLPRTTFFW